MACYEPIDGAEHGEQQLVGFERRTCRTEDCGAEIVLVPTERSEGAKKMPLNPVSHQWRGNVVIVNGMARVLKKDEVQGYRRSVHPLFVSHFFTCPGADKHRLEQKHKPLPGQEAMEL